MADWVIIVNGDRRGYHPRKRLTGSRPAGFAVNAGDDPRDRVTAIPFGYRVDRYIAG